MAPAPAEPSRGSRRSQEGRQPPGGWPWSPSAARRDGKRRLHNVGTSSSGESLGAAEPRQKNTREMREKGLESNPTLRFETRTRLLIIQCNCWVLLLSVITLCFSSLEVQFSSHHSSAFGRLAFQPAAAPWVCFPLESQARGRLPQPAGRSQLSPSALPGSGDRYQWKQCTAPSSPSHRLPSCSGRGHAAHSPVRPGSLPAPGSSAVPDVPHWLLRHRAQGLGREPMFEGS